MLFMVPEEAWIPHKAANYAHLQVQLVFDTIDGKKHLLVIPPLTYITSPP